MREALGRLSAPFAAKPAPQMTAPPARRSMTDQWSRVATVVAEAQARAERAVQNHQGASAQLDAATYALQRLREEMTPAFLFTGSRPPSPAPTPLRPEPFRRREPLAA